jgi:hypothetical protein
MQKEKSKTNSQEILWEDVLFTVLLTRAVLHSCTVETPQHQPTQAPHTYGKSFQTHMQQHLPEQEVQRTSLSLQAPGSTNNDLLKIALLCNGSSQTSVKLCQKETK